METTGGAVGYKRDVNPSSPTLRPQETKEHRSVAAVRRAWYVASESGELRSQPLARTIPVSYTHLTLPTNREV